MLQSLVDWITHVRTDVSMHVQNAGDVNGVVYAAILEFQCRIIHQIRRGFLRRDVNICCLVRLGHVVIW